MHHRPHERTLRTGADAVRFLSALIRPDFRPYSMRAPLALASVRRLLARVDNPQHGLAAIHIGGSKGKGSTALLAEALLESGGYRTATFTSPHLERWTERFRIDGKEVDGERLAATLERLRPHVEALSARHPDDPPSFFDVATAAALLMFREAGVDWAIVEVGLGGRYDATNVVEPVVTCLTGVELEHTDKLGGDLAAIAGEKAGIIKRAVPVVTAPLPPPAAAEVRAQAASREAPLIRLGHEVQMRTAGTAEHTRFEVRGADWRVQARFPLPAHQAQNAALALACVQQACNLGSEALTAAATRAWRRTVLCGRSEVLSQAPWVVVDAAHTPASAAVLRTWLATLPARRQHLVLSVSRDKEPTGFCDALLSERVATVTVACAERLRSLSAEALADILRARRPGLALRIQPDPVQAVVDAFRTLPRDDLLCATGSVYMAGIARSVLRRHLGADAP